MQAVNSSPICCMHLCTQCTGLRLVLCCILDIQPEATMQGASAALKGSGAAVTDFVALIATGLVCYFVDMASGIGLGVAITLIGKALLK